MRGLKLSLFLLSALMIGASCSDDNDQDNVENGKASLTVSIKGQPTVRSIGSSTTNPKVESIVSNFTVLVFNYNTGDLETSKSFTFAENKLTGEIADLSTGTRKRVVTLVNVPTDMSLDAITAYSNLQNNLVSLQSQNSADLETTGLFMSGETTDPVTLTTGDNKVEIPVSRRVAKIVLKSVIVNATPAELTNFKLGEVTVQKARVNGTPIGAVQPADNDVANYAGGIASPNGATPNYNLTYNFLTEALPDPGTYTPSTNIIPSEDQQRYFYVLPNDGANNNATLLTLAGKYGVSASDAYYPFVINGESGAGGTDGTFIQSNKIYEINVIISHPNSPSEDPNVVPSKGTLEVTITPLDWETRIEQNVEW